MHSFYDSRLLITKCIDSCFSASQAMGKRKKPRLTSRKHAGTNGGGKRPTQEPADDASVAGSEASSSASSCSDASVQSRLSKAAKPDALASPRSSTPLPVDPSVRLEKDLRNKKKLLREIERLAAKRRGSLNREELVKLERLGTVRSQVGALEAELGEIHLAALDEEADERDGEGAAAGVDGGEGGEELEKDGEEREEDAEEAMPSGSFRFAERLSSNSSNASLASMAAGMHGDEASEFYERPAPPTPTPGMPPLLRSAAGAGGSSAA